ncbi:uncharacterized protein LOC133832053 [Humulus lupulus]|uniref:uncharacterized protein LOC133832053 n=1 Tax=Humulus lupulus TaxID=3486 RepID=UPI002B40D4A9|nr:uncharacterized protein LOC133832053 [Humulus lupulus]
MSSSNLVTALLSNEKLTRDNYMKWKSNMNIVLICVNHMFFLNEECPEVPNATTAETAKEKYDGWILSNNKVKSYMLAIMSDVLRKKLENDETAYGIWESVQEMFRQQFDKEHVLEMINILHDVEIHSALIYERTQTFESLNKISIKVGEASIVESKPTSSSGKSKKRKSVKGNDKDKDKQTEKTQQVFKHEEQGC